VTPFSLVHSVIVTSSVSYVLYVYTLLITADYVSSWIGILCDWYGIAAGKN